MIRLAGKEQGMAYLSAIECSESLSTVFSSSQPSLLPTGRSILTGGWFGLVMKGICTCFLLSPDNLISAPDAGFPMTSRVRELFALFTPASCSPSDIQKKEGQYSVLLSVPVDPLLLHGHNLPMLQRISHHHKPRFSPPNRMSR